jgi:uncharacterized protein (DUF2141 family)
MKRGIMRPLLMAFALALLPALAAADDTASLTLTVMGVSDAGGDLRIGVYDEAGFKSRSAAPIAGKKVSARSGTMTVTIDGIAPGTYGVKMFQDINRNGHFDFGAMLTEPFGISNDPPLSMTLPPFDDAKFELKPGANAITVTLH